MTLRDFILFLPSIKRLLGNTNPSEQFRQWHSGLGLSQHRHHLFNVESVLLHGKSPFLGSRFFRKLTLNVDQKKTAARSVYVWKSTGLITGLF
jgi:hypothetical protein